MKQTRLLDDYFIETLVVCRLLISIPLFRSMVAGWKYIPPAIIEPSSFDDMLEFMLKKIFDYG